MRRHRLHRPRVFSTPSNCNALERRAPSLETCAVICPICNGPMMPRYGKTGPYFHCLCYEGLGREPAPPIVPAPGRLPVTG
jgi:hypothetical protein